MKDEKKNGQKRKAGIISKSETTAGAPVMEGAACIANLQTCVGY